MAIVRLKLRESKIKKKKHCSYGMEAGSMQGEIMALVRGKLRESKITINCFYGMEAGSMQD